MLLTLRHRESKKSRAIGQVSKWTPVDSPQENDSNPRCCPLKQRETLEKGPSTICSFSPASASGAKNCGMPKVKAKKVKVSGKRSKVQLVLLRLTLKHACNIYIHTCSKEIESQVEILFSRNENPMKITSQLFKVTVLTRKTSFVGGQNKN